MRTLNAKKDIYKWIDTLIREDNRARNVDRAYRVGLITLNEYLIKMQEIDNDRIMESVML